MGGSGCQLHCLHGQPLPVCVDLWRGPIVYPPPSCVPTVPISCFFLSHMHTDHIAGLSSSWRRGPIFASPVTCNLAAQCLGISSSYLKPLSLNKPHTITMSGKNHSSISMTVTLVDANHCPGAVMFLFEGTFGTLLHTGDFRLHECMLPSDSSIPLEESYKFTYNLFCQLRRQRIDRIYLDSTFLHPSWEFPPNTESTELIMGTLNVHPFSTVMVALTSIKLGKEDLLLGLALRRNCKVAVPLSRLEMLRTIRESEREGSFETVMESAIKLFPDLLTTLQQRVIRFSNVNVTTSHIRQLLLRLDWTEAFTSAWEDAGIKIVLQTQVIPVNLIKWATEASTASFSSLNYLCNETDRMYDGTMVLLMCSGRSLKFNKRQINLELAFSNDSSYGNDKNNINHINHIEDRLLTSEDKGTSINIMAYDVGYSLHSSFKELSMFVQSVTPRDIVLNTPVCTKNVLSDAIVTIDTLFGDGATVYNQRNLEFMKSMKCSECRCLLPLSLPSPSKRSLSLIEKTDAFNIESTYNVEYSKRIIKLGRYSAYSVRQKKQFMSLSPSSSDEDVKDALEIECAFKNNVENDMNNEITYDIKNEPANDIGSRLPENQMRKDQALNPFGGSCRKALDVIRGMILKKSI